MLEYLPIIGAIKSIIDIINGGLAAKNSIKSNKKFFDDVVVEVNKAFNKIVVDYISMMLHLRNWIENNGSVAKINNQLKVFSESRLVFMQLRRELHYTCESVKSQKQFEVFHCYFMLVDSTFYYSVFDLSASRQMLYWLYDLIELEPDLNPDDRKRFLERTISVCKKFERAFEKQADLVTREYVKLKLKFHA